MNSVYFDLLELKMYTLSFAMLDDCKPFYGPINISLNNLNDKSIKHALEKISRPFKKYKIRCERAKRNKMDNYDEPLDDEATDDLSFFFSEDYNIDNVTSYLKSKRYFKLNNGKYYMVVFAIDHKRFKIQSKGMQKQLICWVDDDSETYFSDSDEF